MYGWLTNCRFSSGTLYSNFTELSVRLVHCLEASPDHKRVPRNDDRDVSSSYKSTTTH